MAETSSSSNSSSSSSIESRSSVSMSSSSSSSSSSFSSMSTISSSSSSLDSSSSSSSSFMENKDEALIGFSFNVSESHKVNCFEFYKEYCFAALDGDSCVLRSQNRFSWEKYFKVADININCLKIFDNKLFIGSMPSKTICVIDMETNKQINSITVGNAPVKFFDLESQLYLACSNKPSVYKYDTVYKKFDLIYEPHANINDIIVKEKSAYFALDSGNPIVFKSGKWNLFFDSKQTNDTFSSIRKIKQEPFSKISFNFINRENPNTKLTEKDLIEIFPYRRNIGVQSCVAFNDSFLFGGKNYGRIMKSDYASNSVSSVIFDIDESPVNCLFEIDENAILASIGSKLYIGYYGQLKSSQVSNVNSVVSESTANQQLDIDSSKNIKIKSPNGGEVFQYGEEVVISWESNKGIGDFISLDLYKDDKQFYSINSRTSNSGEYIWVVPSNLPESKNYKIYIEWLSATARADDANKDLSNNSFSIVATKQTIDVNENKVQAISSVLKTEKKWYFVPILDLTSEYVSVISKDDMFGQILIGTSKGRILALNKIIANAYVTGEAKIFALANNEFGFYSDKQEVNILYGLVNKILHINKSKEINESIYQKKATILSNESVGGVFVSPIIQIKQDFGFWKDLIWEQQSDENTLITIYLRAANSVEDLYMEKWGIGFMALSNETNPISRNLTNTKIEGKYLQIKVEMNSITNNTNSVVSSVSVSYSTKNAVYFFTTKFSLENDSNLTKGLITANITKPKNTEIYLGITDKNTNEWEQYNVIEPDTFFSTEKLENIKIGVKMVSYDTSLPSVSEFSLVMGGNKINKINLT